MPVLWFNIGDMKKFAALVFASSILAIALCACASSAIGPNENLSGEVSDGRPVFQNEDLKKTYKNFEFSAKFKTSENGNAIIAFHTDEKFSKGYKIAIDNNPNSPNWWRATGSLLGVRNIVKNFAKDGEWFELKLKVSGAEILVWIDGRLVVEYVEPQKPYRLPEFSSMKLSQGCVALRHTQGGKVEVKDIEIKELPDRSDVENQQANAIDETSDAAIKLHQADFPVLDFHVHLKDGFTADWAFAKSRKIGINYSIAPNCGRDFPLNTGQKAQDYLDNLPEDFPFLSCMQAEGREWHILFGEAIRKQFAYAFTDAMTFNDLNGKRTHIWRDNEVNCPIGSEEKYMDLIVDTICKLLADEPADVYANPMRLPSILEKNSKKYWTPERRQKVLNALVKSGKALEINMITRLPDADFIKAAKARGVKFTFGSNNKDSNFGRFEYAYEIIRECKLSSGDIYNPKKEKN